MCETAILMSFDQTNALRVKLPVEIITKLLKYYNDYSIKISTYNLYYKSIICTLNVNH